MSPVLIVYKSTTGFTKKYVDWISKEIDCKIIPIDQFDQVNIDNYEVIVYGAGMHAGRIQGLKDFKKKTMNFEKKDIVVFATGGAPYREEIISKIKIDNFSEDEINQIGFYYFQSGINYERMGLIDKSIMKTYNKVLEFKSNKSDLESGTSKAISKSYDYSSSEYIKPMIEYLNHLTNNSSQNIIP